MLSLGLNTTLHDAQENTYHSLPLVKHLGFSNDNTMTTGHLEFLRPHPAYSHCLYKNIQQH